MSDEELIEKAAKALDGNFNPDKHPIMAAMFRDYAATALAVFREHTEPTDDELNRAWREYTERPDYERDDPRGAFDAGAEWCFRRWAQPSDSELTQE